MRIRSLLLAGAVLALGACSDLSSPSAVDADGAAAFSKIDSKRTKATKSGNTLTVDFRLHGLGNTSPLTVTANATYSAQVTCSNKSRTVSPFTENGKTLSQSGTFDVVKNGSVTGQIRLVGEDLSIYSCPNGLRRSEVHNFSNVTLTWLNQSYTFPTSY
jgi:hypothetical protein